MTDEPQPNIIRTPSPPSCSSGFGRNNQFEQCELNILSFGWAMLRKCEPNTGQWVRYGGKFKSKEDLLKNH